MFGTSHSVGVCVFGIVAVFWLPASSLAQPPPAVPAPLGRLVNVDGHMIHIHCTGTGGPTVVLEAGAGGFSFDWSLVQPDVARFACVCSYDRAGGAWSELGPNPRTIRQKVHEPHTLLKNAGIPGPYVLVGHSGGGYIVR